MGITRKKKWKLKKMKKTPLGISVRNTCAKFQLRRPIIPLSTLPQSSRTYTHTFSDSSSTEVEKKWNKMKGTLWLAKIHGNQNIGIQT